MSSKLSRNLIFIFKEFRAESWSPDIQDWSEDLKHIRTAKLN